MIHDHLNSKPHVHHLKVIDPAQPEEVVAYAKWEVYPQGAGSLLVRWGLSKSKDTGLPVYLQASEQGRRLYSHHGFRDLESVVFNLSDCGLDGTEIMTEMLREASM